MTEIYVYEGDVYLPSKLGLSFDDRFFLGSGDLDLLHQELDAGGTPPDFTVHRPEPIRNPGRALPNLRRAADTIHILPPDLAYPLPDIVAPASSPIVSAGFKDLIEDVDPGMHQFVPCLAYDKDGKPISDKELFHFWVGRIVHFTGTKPSEAPPSTIALASSYRFLNASEEAFRYLAGLPVWRTLGKRTPLFFSSKVFAAMRNAAITGLNERPKASTRPDPVGPIGQTLTVGKFWLPEASSTIMPDC